MGSIGSRNLVLKRLRIDLPPEQCNIEMKFGLGSRDLKIRRIAAQHYSGCSCVQTAEEVYILLVRLLSLKPEDMRPELTFIADLNVCDKDMEDVMIAVAVEKKFGIVFSQEELRRIATVDDLIQVADSKRKDGVR